MATSTSTTKPTTVTTTATKPTTATLLESIRALGFSAVGVALPQIPERDHLRLRSWLAQGYHGEMDWMARDPERRTDPLKVMPTCKAVIVLMVGYHQGAVPGPPGVSRYAWGEDYHLYFEARFPLIADLVAAAFPGRITRNYVDYGPVMERALAESAGLGFIGHSSMLISKHHGTWTFLGAVLTDAPLAATPREPGTCGSCTRCLAACPTGAIVSEGIVDARRCISYLTIEYKGQAPSPIDTGDWIFGCDVCQDVCPYNHRDLQITAGPFLPLPAWDPFPDFTTMEERAFQELFARSPLKRAKLVGMQRQVATRR